MEVRFLPGTLVLFYTFKTKMTKHYVEISFPGSFVSNSSTQEVESRDDFIIPEGAFAYQFFDQEVVEIDGETLCGSPKNHSKTF